MSFRWRMAVVFTLLVGVLLALFGSVIHTRAEALREAEFYDRLEDRALLVERLIDEARNLPVDEAEHLAQALRDALPNEALSVIAVDGNVLFQRAMDGLQLQKSWLDLATRQGRVHVSQGHRQYVVIDTPEALRNGIRYTMASAVDEQGMRSMDLLRRTMIMAGLIALLLTAILSWVYANWALVPVRTLVHTAAEIREPSERIPIPASHRKDELGEIATTFNDMLARLQDAFEMQRSFIAGASHELRTPLTIVRGEVHQALQLVQGDPVLKEKLLIIQDQAIEIQDLLNQLLWLARTRSDPGQMPMDMVRLDELADRAMDRCRMRFPDRPVSLSMSASDEDFEPLVKGNAVLLTAAIYNLLSNAAKYGGDGPIRVSIDTSDRYVWVCISDDGPGMPLEVVERAREMFYRAKDVLTLDGHGIGLALVERIAKAHRGELEFTTAPGQGTKACIRLRAGR